MHLPAAELHRGMEGPADDFFLLFPGQTAEIHRIAGDPNGQAGIPFRVFHSIHQGFPVQYIDVEMVRSLAEIAVQNGHQMRLPLGFVLAQSVGNDGEGIGDSILAHIPVRNFGHGVETGQSTVDIPAVHGVGAGGQRFAQLAAVRRGAGLFAVHNVGGNGQGGERMNGIAVEGMLLELRGEGAHHIYRFIIGPVIIIAVLGEVALGDKVHGDPLLVANGTDFGVADGGKGVCRYGESRNAEGGQALHVGVVEGHLAGLVGVLIVHVVDDIHRVGIELRRVGQDLVVVGPDFFIIQDLVGDGFDAGNNGGAVALVHAAVDGVEQAFGDVAPGAEELHLLAHLHG